MVPLFKRLLIAAFVIVLLSTFFAAPLWALWPYGPHALGAPSIDYLTFAATLATVGVLFVTVYLGGAVMKAAVVTKPR